MRYVLIAFVRIYQAVLSPHLPPMCRYIPSCSQYAVESLDRFGAIRGSVLAAWRLLRCTPWGGFGRDPVPERFRDAFSFRRRPRPGGRGW